MAVFTPVPTLVGTDVNSSSSGSTALSFLPLISISILIPIILFFTYRLFKRAPSLPVRLPLPATWTQWLRGTAKSQSTKSRLSPSKLPKFLKRLSGLSQAELLPTAVKAIPTPSPSPYVYQIAFQPIPTRPGLSTATNQRNLLSRSPSPRDADDYFLSPTKPLEWDLSDSRPPVMLSRPISAPPQARSPSPGQESSGEPSPSTEQPLLTKSKPFRLNITSLFSTQKTPTKRASSISPYSHKRSKSLGVLIRQTSPPSPTSSLAPLIDFSTTNTSNSAPVSSISRAASITTEASDLGARKISSPAPLIPGLPIPQPEHADHAEPMSLPIFTLIDTTTTTPDRKLQQSHDIIDGFTNTPLGPVAMVVQSTPTKMPSTRAAAQQKRGRSRAVDEPLVRLTDSDNEGDEENVELDTIQFKPITPLRKRVASVPSPIALPPLPLSRATSAGQESVLAYVDSPVSTPKSLLQEMEAKTEQILVDIEQDEDNVRQPIAGGLKYPFPMPMTPPPTAPGLGWALENENGEAWSWGGADSHEKPPFLLEVQRDVEIERPFSPEIVTTDVFEDPFADPADMTFVGSVEEAGPALLVVGKKEVEPLALLGVTREVVQHTPEFSPWEECNEEQAKEVKQVEEAKEVWLTEDERTMVAAEASRLVEDEGDNDVEIEIAVVLTEEETGEPVDVVDCVVKVMKEREMDEEEAPVLDKEVELPSVDIEEVIPVSITVEHDEATVVEEYPDPELLPLPVVSSPILIAIPQPTLPYPTCPTDAKSPVREVPLQTPTPPASPPPPPSLSRTSSRHRSRPQTPLPSPRPPLTVELPEESVYTGSITVIPPSAVPLEDRSVDVTPVSPRPCWSSRTLDAPQQEFPVMEEHDDVPKEDVAEDRASENDDVATDVGQVEANKEGKSPVQEDEFEDILSSSLPGSFPPSILIAGPSLSKELQPVEEVAEKTASRSLSQIHSSANLSRIRKPRSAIDIALAMQLRPGLGPGADPAWMVRFLMSVFGWFVVAMSGNIQ